MKEKRKLIAICSCHLHVYEDTMEAMNTHGLGNPAGHHWVYVADVKLVTTLKRKG